MSEVFQCDVCEKVYPHPDLMVECEATHFDAFGVCPNCDSSNCAFDLIQEGKPPHSKKEDKRKYACRECGLVVHFVTDFAQLYDSWTWSKAYARRCGSYYGRDLSDHAWVNLTGWSKSDKKAEFYKGELKPCKRIGAK